MQEALFQRGVGSIDFLITLESGEEEKFQFVVKLEEVDIYNIEK